MTKRTKILTALLALALSFGGALGAIKLNNMFNLTREKIVVMNVEQLFLFKKITAIELSEQPEILEVQSAQMLQEIKKFSQQYANTHHCDIIAKRDVIATNKEVIDLTPQILRILVEKGLISKSSVIGAKN